MPPARRFRSWKTLLIVAILAIMAATAWQLLNRQQNSMIAGRPLSYPQTHLHTVVMSEQPGVVYLGTHYGIFTSTDGGHTWPQLQGDLNTNMITAIAVNSHNPNFLAVLAVPTSGLGKQAGIYVSADAGKSWRFTLPAHLPATAYPYAIQSGVGTHGHFYVFFNNAGWFETRDLGQYWYPITSGKLANIQTSELLTDPTDPAHLLMGGDQGLFETQNDGQSWQQITGIGGSVISLIATNGTTSAPRTIFCSTEQGLYRWKEGQQVVELLNHLPASSIPTRIVTSADGSALYALFGSDLWLSANQGTTWTRLWHFQRSDLMTLALNPANARELLAGFFSPGLVLISTDAGHAWRTLTA